MSHTASQKAHQPLLTILIVLMVSVALFNPDTTCANSGSNKGVSCCSSMNNASRGISCVSPGAEMQSGKKLSSLKIPFCCTLSTPVDKDSKEALPALIGQFSASFEHAVSMDSTQKELVPVFRNPSKLRLSDFPFPQSETYILVLALRI